MQPCQRQESSSDGRVVVPSMGGVVTAAEAAAAVAAAEAAVAEDTWAGCWAGGESWEVEAGMGAAVVEGAVVVSWGSDIAKKNLSCPFLGSSGSRQATQHESALKGAREETMKETKTLGGQ